MESWLHNGNFNDPFLKNSSYSKVGIACACDKDSDVRCAFIFANALIGNEITDSAPKFMPYTAKASCPAMTGASSLFQTSTCSAS